MEDFGLQDLYEELLRKTIQKQEEEKKKSGFFSLSELTIGDDSETFSTKVVVPKGMGYRHVCSECGTTIIIPQQ